MKKDKLQFQRIYDAGILRGYSSIFGCYIEKCYSNPRNYSSAQKTHYKVHFKNEIYVFKTLNEAKLFLEKEYENEN